MTLDAPDESASVNQDPGVLLPEAVADSASGSTTPAATPTLRGAAFPFLTIEIQNASDPDLIAFLNERIKLAPEFFHARPLILDLRGAASASQLKALCDAIRQIHLSPAAFRATHAPTRQAALSIGLPEVFEPAPGDANFVAGQERPKRPMKYVAGPVRSGQTVHAAGGDLTIIGSVSRGAQVYADGSIHVFGPLLGRALAGNDDAEARIVATHFDPELVAIAGLYVYADKIPSECLERPTQVIIQDGHFRIRPLGPL